MKFKLAVLWILRKLHVIGAARHAQLLDYLAVEASPLFDHAWYLAGNRDLVKRRIDPVWHYCTRGWKEGRSPSAMFNVRELAKENPGLLKRNPLLVPPDLKHRPTVSVVVASYNYEDYIKETIESLLVQSYPVEIVVVDDGSRDNSVKVIQEYARKYRNVHLYRHPGGVNRGLPATVRLGVEKAHGEYVAFCESDDVLKTSNIEAKVRLIDRYEGAPDVVINDIECIGDEKRCKTAAQVVADRMKALDQDANAVSCLAFRKQNWICTFSCCMVRRSVLLQCDFAGVPRPANLDWWLWRQVCCGRPIYVVREKLTRWRMHESFMVKESLESCVRQRFFLENMDALLVRRHPEVAAELRPIVERTARCRVRNGVLYLDGRPVADQPKFSFIMPTYNRAFCIRTAIDSLLAQTYGNFELIVVDDGSTDDTGALIETHYAAELKRGRIKYIRVPNGGTCRARNRGFDHVTGEWIAYLDSDNTITPYFLEAFCREIALEPEAKNLYAKLVCVESRRQIGHEFDLDSLLKANFIDLGVYVHRRELIEECGRFDTNMTRLVDWELIVRQCKAHTPVFVNETVLLYNDSEGFGRITNSVSLKKNMDYFRLKHCGYPIVTTMITAYNHEKYIKRAIETAVMQKGDFVHEILVSDDCSTDGTRRVIAEMMKLYPGYITDISGDRNLGISENMRKCFKTARGKYIAVLEGDDYWTSEWKLNRQMKFLGEHPECSMMFNRIKLLDDDTGKFSVLPRQNLPKGLLTGEDFIRDPNQNLIANFSCAMFVRDCLLRLPNKIYSERFNEIGAAFALERMGPIGFLPDIMTAYRIHSGSTWSAVEKRGKLESAIRLRELALRLAAPQYRDRMQQAIDWRRRQLAELEKEDGNAR